MDYVYYKNHLLRALSQHCVSALGWSLSFLICEMGIRIPPHKMAARVK